MEITKVKTTRDYELFNAVVMKGSILFVAGTYRPNGSTVDQTKIFNAYGEILGNIKGHYFDYANKTLFEVVKEAL